MSSKNALAFAVGLGSGYMNAKRQATLDERQAKRDKMQDDLHQITLANYKREEAQRRSLADAASPRESIAGTIVEDGTSRELYKDPNAVTPAMLEDRRIEAEMRAELPGTKSMSLASGQQPKVQEGYGVTGASLGNQITTTKPDSTALNSDAAVGQRIRNALLSSGDVKGAQSYRAAEAQIRAADQGAVRTDLEIEALRRKHAAEVKREGYEGLFRALRTRDPQAAFDAFNAQGNVRLMSQPQIVGSRKVKTPWGEIDDDVWEGSVRAADGAVRTVRLSTFDLGQRLSSVADLLAAESKAGEKRLGHSLELDKLERSGSITRENQTHQGHITRQNQAHNASVTSGTKFNSMDRMLLDGRVAAARKDLSDIDEKLANPVVIAAKPGGGQFWDEKQRLLSVRAQAQAEYDRWSQVLEQAASNSASKVPGLSNGEPPRISSKAERDKLPKGARYVAPDGQTYIKQ